MCTLAAIKSSAACRLAVARILHMLAVREGEWKLIGSFLANLNDPQPERKNYINAKPEIAKRLLTLHNEWRNEVDGDGTAVPPNYVNSAEEVGNSSLDRKTPRDSSPKHDI